MNLLERHLIKANIDEVKAMNEELLNCPFCGGLAEIKRKGTARASMLVACTNCGCRMESGDVYGLTKPQVWAWNRRNYELARETFGRAWH